MTQFAQPRMSFIVVGPTSASHTYRYLSHVRLRLENVAAREGITVVKRTMLIGVRDLNKAHPVTVWYTPERFVKVAGLTVRGLR